MHWLRLYLLVTLLLGPEHTNGSPPENGTPKGPGNIYGLKVFYQLIPRDPVGQEMIFDVEKTYNSDPHYLQCALNYAESWWGYFLRCPYHVSIQTLYAMLTLAMGKDIRPTTTDDAFLTNAWWAYEAWNGCLTPGLLRYFQIVFPQVSRVRLVAQSGRKVILTSSSRLSVQEFKAVGLDITTSQVFSQRF